MAVEQIRPDSRAEQGGRLKTQDLNVGAGTAILFKIPRRAADSFISMPRYIQNEGMPEAERFSFLLRSDSDAWNMPLARAEDGRDVLYMLLSPGDEPGADALLELAAAGGQDRDADLLYGDELRVSPVSCEKEPFFKPDFSPDLMLSTNYIGRPWAATASLLAQTGASAASLAANGDYDLVLRCAEH